MLAKSVIPVFLLSCVSLLLTACLSSGPVTGFDSSERVQQIATGAESFLSTRAHDLAQQNLSPEANATTLKLPPGTRVLVAPLNFIDQDLSYLKPQASKLSVMLQDHLRRQGLEIVSSHYFAEVWQSKLDANPHYFNPNHAQFKQELYDSALLETLNEVASKVEVDTFLFANVIETEVLVSRSKASWSGVQRQLDVQHQRDNRHLRMITDDFVWSGKLTGLSLSVEAVDSQGLIIYRGIGGIGFRDQVLAVPKNNQFHSYERVASIIPLAKPLADSIQLQEGIAIALDAFAAEGGVDATARNQIDSVVP